MPNYYFVLTLLPALEFAKAPEIGSRELDFLLKLNLDPADLAKVVVIKRLVDMENIRTLWQNHPMIPGGNFFDHNELKDALYLQTTLPKYVYSYLDKYTTTEHRIQHFPELFQQFFTSEIKKSKGFLQKYLILQWHSQITMLALRAKRLERDIEQELFVEKDTFIQTVFDQYREPFPILEEPFDELVALFEKHKDAPLDLEMACSQWQFDKIDQMPAVEKAFGIDRILSYVAQLKLIEEKLLLDTQKGLTIVEEMVQ